MCKWGVPSAAKENHHSKSTTEQTKHNKIWETVSNLHVGDTLRSAIARAKQSKAWKTLSNLSVSDTLKSTAKRAKQSKAWKTLSNLSVSDTLKSVAVQVKQSKALKITAGTTVGASAVAGTAVAGLKIFEDSLPESVKEYLPNWLRKSSGDNQAEHEVPRQEGRTLTDSDDGVYYADSPVRVTNSTMLSGEDAFDAMSGDRRISSSLNDSDAAMPGNITKSEPEIPASDNQKKCPAKCYKNMEDVRDTEIPGNITNSTSNVNNSGNVTQPKQPRSRKKSVKPIMNKNNEEGHKKGIDWNRVTENFKSGAVAVFPPIIILVMTIMLIVNSNKPQQARTRY